ncbi:MAG: GNAT family N-acetyltransferase [Azospirillaceae bacterium]|nr:GNAT family N-acetyltransferase [Azospirillaceae bacterium]
MIDYLANHRELIPVVATWMFETWGYRRPERTFADYVARVTARTNIDRLPLGLVAICGGVPVGTTSLVPFEDTEDAPGPWVSAVFVVPAYRGRGIATALLARIEREALRLGASQLMLGAAVPDFYRRLGFVATGATKRGDPLMAKQLATPIANRDH